MSAGEVSRIKGLLRVTMPLLDEPLRSEVLKTALAVIEETLPPSLMQRRLQRAELSGTPPDVRELLERLIAAKAAEIALRPPVDPAEQLANYERRQKAARERVEGGDRENPSSSGRPTKAGTPSAGTGADGHTEHAVQPKVPQLPVWGEDCRAAPNLVLRSALFAAVRGNQRKSFDRETLGSWGNVVLRYTGWQLDQSDLDVWQMCLHLAREQPAGAHIEFSNKSMLRAMGRFQGTADKEWLASSIRRLASGGVEITAGKLLYGGSLITEYFRDETSGRFVIAINPRLCRLFDPGWTQIDRAARDKLRGKPLALWLTGFCATHTLWRPIKVSTLRDLCGSSNTELRDFRRSLKAALKLVEAEGVISTHSIDKNDLVHLGLKLNASQTKYLEAKRKRRRRSKSSPGATPPGSPAA